MILLIGVPWPLASQESPLLHPSVKTPVYFDRTAPLASLKPVPVTFRVRERRSIGNKIGYREFHRITANDLPETGDPVVQTAMGQLLPDPGSVIRNFEGMNNLSFIFPPDPQGDVGPAHYVQVVNTNLTIFSKTGSVLYGPVSLGTIWQGIPDPWNGEDGGDPIVLYDQAADRWIISQLSMPAFMNVYAELVAVSQTSDPTGPWYRYVYDFDNVLPDYPKFGIWPDGYYLSVNQFEDGQTWAGAGVMALNRDAMLAGVSDAALVFFDLGASAEPVSMLPADWDGTVAPPAGEPNSFVYFNDWSSPVEDYLKIWQFSVNWTNPAASTFTAAASLTTAPFESQVCADSMMLCIDQPGTGIRLMSISDRLMFRLQYRNFGGYRSMVTNHTVKAGSDGHAGIRWYELRNAGNGWSIHQQGTYAPDLSHRWMGSIAMNAQGDIALGYSVSDGSSVYPSIRYTGRRNSDPPGVMTLAEQTIMAGSGIQVVEEGRWGDYSMMSVDPEDDLTFWYTSEYMQDMEEYDWKTRVAAVRKITPSPDALTKPATGITLTSAQLNGEVNPNGLATTWYFEWGSSVAYGNSTPVTAAGAGTSNIVVSHAITGITSGTTWHFRLVATNSQGTSHGRDLTFTPGIAVVGTWPATQVTNITATAGGQVDSDGGYPVVQRGICWGTTPDPAITGNHTHDGSGMGAFTTILTGLTPDMTYHLRAFATTSLGTWYGPDRTFRTACGQRTIPMSENFNLAVFPSCWKEQTEGSGILNSWTVSPTANAGGAPSEMVSEGQMAMSGTTRLVTIPLNTVGISQLNLSFRHRLDSWFYGAIMKIQSSTDGMNWTDEEWWVESDEYGIPATTVNTTITNNLGSQTTYIGFAASEFLFSYLYWYIDNVTVTGVCGPFVTPPWEEGFARDGAIPLCWSQADHQGNGQGWKSGKVSQPLPLPALQGNYAYLDSYGYGAGNSQNADLISPVLNLSASSSPRLRFYHYFRQSPGSSGTVSFSTDQGATWTLLRQFNVTSPVNPAIFDQAIPEAAGKSAVQFKWNYTGSNGNIWAIDSIMVGDIPQNLNLTYPSVPDTACFDALSQIIVAGNNNQFLVPAGGSVTLIAGGKILLLPPTVATQGSQLHAMISSGGEYCGSAISMAPGAIAEGNSRFPEQVIRRNSFRVYPNPFRETLSLELPAIPAVPVEVTFFDIRGIKISSTRITGTNKHTFSFARWPEGVWLMRVVSGNESEMIRIIHIK